MKVDKHTVKRIDTAHPVLRSELHQIYNDILDEGIGVRFTSVFRSFHEQEKLYNLGRGRSSKRKVTNAKGGQSYHNYGLAIDFCLLTDNGRSVSWDRSKDLNKDGKKDWQQVVDIFKSYGWEWGGDWRFKDYPHFQKTFGYHWSDLLELKEHGKAYPKIKIDEEYL